MCSLGLAAAALLGCGGNKAQPIAELIEMRGPVERGDGGGNWTPAKLHTLYYLGDAAHTLDPATFDLAGGAATIITTSETMLRFAGTRDHIQIDVTSGAIDIKSENTYVLDVGDTTLRSGGKGGTVHVTAKQGGTRTFELVVGKAEIATADSTFQLVLHEPRDVEPVAKVARDAGATDARPPADAAIDAPVDAPPDADTSRNARIVVTGKRAQLRAPGDPTWKPLPEGAGDLAPGSGVRLGAATTAQVVASGTTLEMGGGAHLELGTDLQISLELGGTAAMATEPVSIALPGGAVALEGGPGARAVARIDGNARETRIAMVRGSSKLTGAAGAQHALDRGESATLDRNGAIRYIDTIPRYFDFRVVAGESLAIHDPRPPSAVQFQFDGKCSEGGIIEIDRNGSFRTARVSSGRDFANVMITPGSWSYRLRCTVNGTEGPAIASGRVTELTDDGRRPLPTTQGVNEIDFDGRNYRIYYQSSIPNVAIRVKNPGALHRLHLAQAGKEQTFDSSTPVITVPGSRLREGTYTYWIDRDGVKLDKVSTLSIEFDQTAPQVYIESPINGQPWSGDIDVRGAVLPGWVAEVDAIALPIDRHRRFIAKVGVPGGNALAIRLSHPVRGVHYYLRRPK